MAGAGYRDWTAGEKPTADQFDTYLQEQTVMVFADASARDTALSTAKAEGMVAFLKDTNTLTVYSGSAWSTIGPVFGALTSWTPSWTNLTIGSATVAATYSRVGRLITCQLLVQWAADTSISGDVSFTLPVDANVTTEGLYMGGCGLFDADDVDYHGAFISKDADEAYIRYSPGGDQSAALTSTNPFTWTTNDLMRGMFSYVASADA